MKASIPLGRWFGIPVGLHYSWFILAWLIALSLTTRFASMNSGWSTGTVWALALVTAALFFVSIVLHELAHSIVARASGVPVRGITLFALGGVSQIEKEASSPGKEFWIAVVGPITSLVIGVACRVSVGAAGLGARTAAPSALTAVLGWLAYINIALGLFNLIPGFPLDGGRVLRAIVWELTRSADRATRIAARVGQVVGFAFIAGGFFSLVLRGNFGGLWIAIIGWFLLESAQAYYAMAQVSSALRGVRVADVMARQCATIDPDTTLRRFVDDELLRLTSNCFAVVRQDQILGLIASEDVKRVPHEEWDRTTVAQVMRPIQALHPLAPDVPAHEALDLMGRENINQVPVVTNGHLAGVVTRSYLVHLLQVRRELHA
ncbi:MAG TPA: site-2 protease family protein [Vicinamibacterales bacterium]|jgi:Zn-dependent protease/CBS domain-containing protein